MIQLIGIVVTLLLFFLVLLIFLPVVRAGGMQEVGDKDKPPGSAKGSRARERAGKGDSRSLLPLVGPLLLSIAITAPGLRGQEPSAPGLEPGHPAPGETGTPVGHANDAEILILGNLRNGTTGQPVTVERLELLRPGGEGQEGLQSLETLEPSGPAFQFRPVNRNGGPLLLRATRKGDTFMQVISPSGGADRPGRANPPAGGRAPLAVPVTLTVFDRGATAGDVEFHSGLQVSRGKDGLDVTLVYAVANHSNPPRSLASDDLIIPVPRDAKDLHLTLTHQESGMPVTLDPISVEGGVRFNHAIRPGSSELSARFHIEGYTYRDRIDFTREKGRKSEGVKPSAPFTRILIWRPLDAKPDVEGGSFREFDIPNLGRAIQVTYDRNEVVYEFRNGGVWYESPMDSHSNPIFDRPWKTAVGLLMGLTILLFILSLLTGIRVRQKENIRD